MSSMKRLFEIGGYVAAVVLIGFGVTALVLGIGGRNDIRNNLAHEKIVGSADMTPAAIKAEAAKAGITSAQWPTQSVAGQAITTGSQARAFGDYMRIHTLEATGGQVYSQMARFLTPGGKPTNDEAAAAKDDKGQPVANHARDIWITYTALTTALNQAYLGEQVSNFSMVVAVALIVAGIGLGVLGFSAFRWLPARETERETEAATSRRQLRDVAVGAAK